MFTFYFDNTIVNNPINWNELSETLERNDELRGLFLKIDQTLTFTDEAYAYLYNAKQSNGYCQFIELKITKQCNNGNTLIFEGNIRISDCKFNLSKCTVECGIEDNSFGARIFNNKSIKAFVNGGFSKNGVAITTANTYYLYLYEPSTNILDNTAFVNAFDVMECFEYLVKFMTDGQMDVVSDWYSNLPLTEKLCVTTGAELRKRQHLKTDVPSISFDDLFKEMNKKFNLGMSVENINSVWTLRIEPMSYFFDTALSATTDSVPNLVEYINTYNLYSKIRLGSSKTANYDNTIHSMPPIRFLTFNDEDYIIEGQCNIDRELNCVNNYIIDSNVIEEVAFTNTNDKQYDKDIFIIQYEESTLVPNILFSVMWNDIIAQPPVFFNETLTNDNVALRWDVQNNIAQYINAANNKFRAEQTIPSPVYRPFTSYAPPITLNTPYTPIPFDDDSTPPNYDAGGNYNTTTYRYLAQANGIYSFQVRQDYVLYEQEYQGGLFDISWSYLSDRWNIIANVYNGVTLVRSASKMTPYKQWLSINWASYLGNPIPAYLSLANLETIDVYMNAGEEVEFAFEFAFLGAYQGATGTSGNYGTNLQILLDAVGGNSYYFYNSTVECIATADGGGKYVGKDPDDYKVSLFSYEYPLSDTTWNIIKNAPSKAIQFGINNATKKGWVSKIIRNANTGMASIELISNIKNTSN